MGGSQIVHSAKAGGARSQGQVSSPNHHAVDQNRSVNSGKNKQIQMYDPAYAGKQLVEHGGVGRGKSNPGQGSKNVGNANPAGRGIPPRHPTQNQSRQQLDAGYVQQPQGGN